MWTSLNVSGESTVEAGVMLQMAFSACKLTLRHLVMCQAIEPYVCIFMRVRHSLGYETAHVVHKLGLCIPLQRILFICVE